jgi:nitrite reductase (NADH) large subunit
VGDVAEFNQVLWSIIPAALAQARVAAAQIAGEADTLYREIVPSTSLQVTGINLTSVGVVNPEGADGCIQIRHTDLERGIYRKLVIREGRVVGAISLGDRSEVRAMTQLINRATDVSAHLDVLLREGFDLASLLR